MKKIKLKNKGFSLVEILISMAVLTLGLTTIAALMVSSMRQSNEAKNQMIASGLAEEGIELTMNLKERNPDDFKAGSVLSDYYTIDTTTALPSDLAAIGVSNTGLLYLKSDPSSSKFYTHNSTGTTATIFYRKIKITNETNQVKVTSYVTWSPAGTFPTTCNVANKCVSVTSIMLDQ